MARKVKCKICKNQLTTDNAYRITKENKEGKKINFYYCTEGEYTSQQKAISDKKSMLEAVATITNVKIISSAFMKQLNELLEHYEPIVVEKTFKNCEKTINWSLEKNFHNEFARAKYIIAIIKNNIESTYKQHIKDIKGMEYLFAREEKSIDIDILNNDIEVATTRKVTDISNFLD